LGAVLGGASVSNKMMEYNTTLFNICDLVGRNLTLPAAVFYATLYRSRRAPWVALFVAAFAVSCVLTGSTLCHLYVDDPVCHTVWDPVDAGTRDFIDTGLVLLRSREVIVAFLAVGLVQDVFRLIGALLTSSLKSAVLTLTPLLTLTLGAAKGSNNEKENEQAITEIISHLVSDKVSDEISEKVYEKVSEKVSQVMAVPEKLSRMASDASHVAESVYSESLWGDCKTVTGEKRTVQFYRMFWGSITIKVVGKNDKDGMLLTYLRSIGGQTENNVFSNVTTCMNMNNRVSSTHYYNRSFPHGSLLHCFCRHTDVEGIQHLLEADTVDIAAIGRAIRAVLHDWDPQTVSPKTCASALHQLATAGKEYGSLIQRLTATTHGAP
jgi:hypothetical protein